MEFEKEMDKIININLPENREIRNCPDCPMMRYALYNNVVYGENLPENPNMHGRAMNTTFLKNAALWCNTLPEPIKNAKQLIKSQNMHYDKIGGWMVKITKGTLTEFNCDELENWQGAFELTPGGFACKTCKLKNNVFKNESLENLSERITLKIEKELVIKTIRDDSKEEFWIYNDGIWKPNGKSYVEQYCRKEIGKKLTSQIINLVNKKVELDCMVERKDFFMDENVDLLCLKNGVFNLKTKELLPYSSEYKFFNKLPIIYNPIAECQKIDEFINSIVKLNDTKLLFQLFGWCLYRKYQPQEFVILLGSGATWKSVLLKLLQHFLGIENITNVSPQMLQDRPFLKVCLWNKMANLCAEIPSDKDLKSEFIKTITGEDNITVDRKFLSALTFVSYAKIIMNVNQLPEINDDTTSFWRRFAFIQFPYTFRSTLELEELRKTKELTDFDKLAIVDIFSTLLSEEEISGLFNKAITELSTLLKQGSFNIKLNNREKKDFWNENCNNFEIFAKEYIKYDFEKKEKAKDIKKIYSIFCKQHKKINVSNKKITSTMIKIGSGFTRNRRLNEDFWESVTLNWNKIEENFGIKKEKISEEFGEFS
jgi:P4 family phage/plasmid primase-like protien